MDNILSCTGYIQPNTVISNAFIEHFMLDANGSYVKIYLYLSEYVQSGRNDISITFLADKMDSTERDIARALQHWEKKGLIGITPDEVTGQISSIQMFSPDDVYASSKSNSYMEDTAVDVAGTPQIPFTSEKGKNESVSISPELRKNLAENKDFQWVCQVVESFLERPFKPNEIELISYLYGTLHFSSELLLHLYEYCISLGKSNSNYIQAVALSWHEQGVKTPEDAKRVTTDYNTAYTAISKAFGLGRPLAIIEKQFVERWQKEWMIDLSVIIEACNRTMLKIQKADFKYTEGILDNWHKSGIKTLLDVEKADEIYARRKAEKNTAKNNNNQNSYRYNANTNSSNGYVKKNQFNTFRQRDTSHAEISELERKLLNR
ncbi:DnaD domain protein [Eubacterium sp. MSJ-13]|uniref:DnaD domain protein n=1 Tax=Eubacterium sp. MSJ-13 TaxID=2841513 RepID=UPI001C11DB39|nr:DnaD domain protein [Eubacterium sp. MSJ-13]MBU5478347.1 DnaD domain protein [Eubacterium sp. MSJ-13]